MRLKCGLFRDQILTGVERTDAECLFCPIIITSVLHSSNFYIASWATASGIISSSVAWSLMVVRVQVGSLGGAKWTDNYKPQGFLMSLPVDLL